MALPVVSEFGLSLLLQVIPKVDFGSPLPFSTLPRFRARTCSVDRYLHRLRPSMFPSLRS